MSDEVGPLVSEILAVVKEELVFLLEAFGRRFDLLGETGQLRPLASELVTSTREQQELFVDVGAIGLELVEQLFCLFESSSLAFERSEAFDDRGPIYLVGSIALGDLLLSFG